MRIFPDKAEQEKLQLLMDQYRWYYNATLTIFYNHYGYHNILKQSSYSNYSVRQILRKYKYTEELKDNKLFKDFVFEEQRDAPPVPVWWDGEIHSRLPRGATKKFVSAINSAITNYHEGNIKKFFMKYMTRKDKTEYFNFEDKQYPAFINKIKSNYWYTTKDHQRKRISLSEISAKKRGIEVIHEKTTGKYFLHYPVDRDWYPEDDRRNDSQATLLTQKERIISLDPGVRKFLVGYDPKGKSIFIGEEAQATLISLLFKIDKKIGDTSSLWKRVKNLVNELHWKTINFLIKNYDTILLPEFPVSKMIRGKKLGRKTKRLMMMYSFYAFKQKLLWKAKIYGKNVIIVDESYTSRTCSHCGHLNNIKGKETFQCSSCEIILDRDVNGSRNILIKNITLR